MSKPSSTGQPAAMASLSTERLLLRGWLPEDLEPFVQMNADPEVMRYFEAPANRQETEIAYKRIIDLLDQRRFGLWAVEVVSSKQFIGFVGLQVPRFETHFTPCVEIGWLLAKEHWGQGYAPEAAQAVLSDGFLRIGLSEVVSMTATLNKPSMRVMEKIGMTYDPQDDFDHPLVVEGPLRRHVLYRLKRSQWQAAQK
jgi:RimJ/RimL family protein N-acetyltransferase